MRRGLLGQPAHKALTAKRPGAVEGAKHAADAFTRAGRHAGLPLAALSQAGQRGERQVRLDQVLAQQRDVVGQRLGLRFAGSAAGR
jgi:hypothetical protein